MNKVKNLLFATLFGIALVACSSQPLSSQIDNYVTDVEANCDSWTEEDWELSQEEYVKLLEEYELNYDSYTQEERNAINKAIGRYNGLLIKHGIQEAGSALKDLGERIPSLIEGFMSAFDAEEEESEE